MLTKFELTVVYAAASLPSAETSCNMRDAEVMARKVTRGRQTEGNYRRA